MSETDTNRCPHGFAFAFGCDDCTRAYNAREQLQTELREREAAALGVLCDLVAYWDDEQDFFDRLDQDTPVTEADSISRTLGLRAVEAKARARRLVAEHTTDEDEALCGNMLDGDDGPPNLVCDVGPPGHPGLHHDSESNHPGWADHANEEAT